MEPFTYHDPQTLDAAISLLNQIGPGSRLLAGGTALLVDMNAGHASATDLISLTGVPGLDRIEPDGDGWRLGAMTLLSDIEKFSPFDTGAYRTLGEATRSSGGRQIRNMGTIGGNICHASPGADLVPPLLCLDARLRIAGPEGERETPLDGFLRGPGQTGLAPAEIVTEILLPVAPARSGSAFLKVMRRKAMDCSIVAVAARVSLAPSGDRIAAARVAVGAAAPVPFLVPGVDDLLRDQIVDDALLATLGQHAATYSRPITDVRASAEYRRRLVDGLVQRAVREAWELAKAGEAVA